MIRRVVFAAFLSVLLGAGQAAYAYDQLKAPQLEKLLPGTTFNMRVMHPMDIVFFKNGTFKVQHHDACSGGEKSQYKINRWGRLTLEFRNCDGKRRSTMRMEVYQKDGAYYVRDSHTRSYYPFVKLRTHNK